ncbi:putative TIM-barrel fold metal-dependent hydrolase [Kibdelosporangium banguiense]|uniref:TIM-barrel fold metal-dependent hydrolase n=1 Tax=Kibdelosporangium banguiense TaxID=1365924 RepID=A0ABS4TMR3_9PSEU|nr:amidohydrolase family protein [Kibdelosporangium banguiense]MBP2325208.1 putative TIM-barrel fold metal-dependent hydrolase [Kibdelosporangium banguiense]
MLVDAHMHVPRLSTLKPAWLEWATEFGGSWRDVYSASGDPIPSRLDALLESEGVSRALLFCEYSPRATGMQTIEDLLPIFEHNPDRFRLVANVNPHLHHPVSSEVERQLDLGAVALKIHPVHGGFAPDDPELYAAYNVCLERGVPVILHSGVSSFPGSQAKYGNPELMLDVLEQFPDLNFVFAHGGRGWWYDTAAFLALAKPNVWLDLAGLPPRKLPEYYGRFDLRRLATKWIFGTDWPGVPGIRRNAQALTTIGLPDDILQGVLSGNAAKIFPGLGI